MIIMIVLLQECDPKLLPDTCTQDKIMYNVLDESPVRNVFVVGRKVT